MKTMLCSLFVLTLIPGVSLSQDSTTPDIVVHFTIPKGWKAGGDSTFVRTNLAQAFTFWHNELEEGHMPWRYDPKNVAVTCLQSFGIHDGSPGWIFADRLSVIRKGSVYSLKADSTRYDIYVKTKDSVPIASKLMVRRVRRAVGEGTAH